MEGNGGVGRLTKTFCLQGAMFYNGSFRGFGSPTWVSLPPAPVTEHCSAVIPQNALKGLKQRNTACVSENLTFKLGDKVSLCNLHLIGRQDNWGGGGGVGGTESFVLSHLKY